MGQSYKKLSGGRSSALLLVKLEGSFCDFGARPCYSR